MAGDCQYLEDLKKSIKSGETFGPDIYYSALVGSEDFIKHDKRAIICTPTEYEIGKAPGMRIVNDNTDLDQLMKVSLDIGATGIKIYEGLSTELVNEVTTKAHNFGLKVWSHGIVVPATLEDVINAGVNTISHAAFFTFPEDWSLAKYGSTVFDTTLVSSDKFNQLIQTMKKNKTVLDPTLTLSFRMDKMKSKDDKLIEFKKNFICKFIKKLHDSGIKIIAGTDIFLPSKPNIVPELHEEIRILSDDVGLGKLEALKGATIYGAEVLGIENKYGSIETGKIANLVVLNSNPLSEIENTSDIDCVIKNGKIIK